MRIVVLGATGNLGTALVERLVDAPDVTEVVGVARRLPRSAGAASPTGQPVRWVQADVRVDDLDYYRAFCWWRMAVIGEGIKRRYEAGVLAGRAEDMRHVCERVERLALLADHHLQLHGA